MRYERTLEAWVQRYPDEMADMLKPLNEYFNTLLAPQTFENNYKIFWDYLVHTQWNRIVLNPMHYVEAEDIAEINLMTERVRSQLISNMDALQNKHAYLNQLRDEPLSVASNYDITKVGSETISNHSYTSDDNSDDASADTENSSTVYQNKKQTQSKQHTYDGIEVDDKASDVFYENYAAETPKPAIKTDTKFNTKSATTHTRDGVREYGRKGGKTIAEQYDDVMNALSYNYIEDICKVIMRGFMYYVYA